MIDQTVRHSYPGKYYDKDAGLAKLGNVNEFLLKELLSDSFFHMPFPKTTGPELFNREYLQAAQKRSQTESLDVNDLLATLTRFSAEAIGIAIRKATGKNKFEIYLSGGGAHNPLLTQWLLEILDLDKVRTTEELGVPGDAKEAILFAVLANESLVGGKVNFGTRAKIPSVSMGKFSFAS